MPSWYPSLMGKSILKQTGVPFGIDYQDPWVQPMPAVNERHGAERP